MNTQTIKYSRYPCTNTNEECTYFMHWYHRKGGVAARLCGPCLWTVILQDHLDIAEMDLQDPSSMPAPAQPTCPQSPQERIRNSIATSHPKASGSRGQTPLIFPGLPALQLLPFTMNLQGTTNSLWEKRINPGMTHHRLE